MHQYFSQEINSAPRIQSGRSAQRVQPLSIFSISVLRRHDLDISIDRGQQEDSLANNVNCEECKIAPENYGLDS